MRKISKVEPTISAPPTRLRVAAYARVSVEQERSIHSMSAQISYYNELIQKNPEREFAGVYADLGISGTGINKRDEFKRLIDDCNAGKIDIILTKSISRFARNTVDLLETVRHLKDLGIEVRFERENISSMSGDGELMLSILASFVQEESISISENCKWGIRKRFETGEIGTANKHILGYRYDEKQRKYIIIPDEAAIVRRIFELYINGVSLQGICDDLNEKCYRTVSGKMFYEGLMAKIVKNEVYAGDILRQKTYTTDPITKNKVENRGELPKFLMQDSHEAIIDRETYAKVQAETERRVSLLNPTYCFTKKIKCGICGKSYTRKTSTVRGKKYSAYWICRSKKECGISCTSCNFSESNLKKICAEVLGTNGFSESEFYSRVLCMTVLKDGNIEFNFIGGKSIIWKNPHISETRHIATVTDCFKDKLVCGTCGSSYHRKNGANRWVYWYCIGKKNKETNCKNRIFADYQLRNISALVLGLDEFNEREFEEQIAKITVQSDGGLLYEFKDGRTKLWQE